MAKQMQTGVAQPDQIEQPENTRPQQPGSGGGQSQSESEEEDQPGADGPSSVPADEDTYD